MTVKRNKLNEYIIKQCLDGEMAGYNSSFNGMWVFSIKNSPLYGGWVLETPNDMGKTIDHITYDNIETISNIIQDTLLNIEKIYENKKRFDEYCSNNPWTYSGT